MSVVVSVVVGVSVVVVSLSVVVAVAVVDSTSFSALVQPRIQSFSSCSLRPAATCFAPKWHTLSILDQDWFVALYLETPLPAREVGALVAGGHGARGEDGGGEQASGREHDLHRLNPFAGSGAVAAN